MLIKRRNGLTIKNNIQNSLLITFYITIKLVQYKIIINECFKDRDISDNAIQSNLQSGSKRIKYKTNNQNVNNKLNCNIIN